MHQTTKCSPVKTGEYPRIMKTIASIRSVNMFVDLPLDITCSSKLKVSLELCSQMTVCILSTSLMELLQHINITRRAPCSMLTSILFSLICFDSLNRPCQKKGLLILLYIALMILFKFDYNKQ